MNCLLAAHQTAHRSQKSINEDPFSAGPFVSHLSLSCWPAFPWQPRSDSAGRAWFATCPEGKTVGFVGRLTFVVRVGSVVDEACVFESIAVEILPGVVRSVGAVGSVGTVGSVGLDSGSLDWPCSVMVFAAHCYGLMHCVAWLISLPSS